MVSGCSLNLVVCALANLHGLARALLGTCASGSVDKGEWSSGSRQQQATWVTQQASWFLQSA